MGKTRKGKATIEEPPKTLEKSATSPPPKVNTPKLPQKEEPAKTEDFQINSYAAQNNINFSTYQHLDLLNFEPMPVSLFFYTVVVV